MFRKFFRKRILASQTGLAYYYAVAFFIAMSLEFGFHPHNIIINASASSLFGLWMANKFHKDNKYLVKKINDDKFDTTRKFNKMLKNEELPKTKLEKSEYLEFLLEMEQNKIRLTKANQLWAFAFLIVVFSFYVISTGFNIWAVLFIAAIASAGYTFIKSKNDLKKIESVKEKLSRAGYIIQT